VQLEQLVLMEALVQLVLMGQLEQLVLMEVQALLG
jgi:hypothetical protein